MIQRLETERLYMRPFEISDAEAMFAMDKNPNVHKYLWQQPVTSIEETLNIIQFLQDQYASKGIGRFATFLKDSDTFIGWTGIKYIDDHIENGNTNFFDYGYRLAEEHWGKGYATEASIKWLEYGFEVMKIPTMNAYTHTENGASNHILKKIGFEWIENYPDPQGVFWNWWKLDNPLHSH